MNTLNQVDLIQLNISLWQGNKALRPEDLEANGIDSSKLPPGNLASLGMKRTISKDATKIFQALKREAQQACLSIGTKFGDSTYAVPQTSTQAVLLDLASIKTKFAAAKDKFMQKYAIETTEFVIAQDPVWRTAIKNAVDSPDKVRSALHFNFSAYTINPVIDPNNGIEEEVQGLFGQFCKEMRAMANLALKTSYTGNVIGKKALRPITNIIIKMNSMSFLDPEISVLANELHDARAYAEYEIKWSKNKECKGTNLSTLIGVLTKIANMGIKQPVQIEIEEEEEVIIEPPPTPIDILDFDVDMACPTSTEPVATIDTVEWDF